MGPDTQLRLFPEPDPAPSVTLRLTVLQTKLWCDFRFGGTCGIDGVTPYRDDQGSVLLQNGKPVAYVVEPPLYIETLLATARRQDPHHHATDKETP